ncbi:unnamed protein product [Moneuplotes crassus]|uniref:CKK domain-containing protein n=1 Tax=Euplotes crassus TaxID=5936 RepID=A0AAD1XY69_EUPCR|nr:unnamed protein product [Moneuplotes crassus]
MDAKKMTPEQIREHAAKQRALLQAKIKKKQQEEERIKKEKLEKKRKEREQKRKAEEEAKRVAEEERLRAIQEQKEQEEQKQRELEQQKLEKERKQQELEAQKQLEIVNEASLSKENTFENESRMSIQERQSDIRQSASTYGINDREETDGFDSTFQDREYSEFAPDSTFQRSSQDHQREHLTERSHEVPISEYNPNYGLSQNRFEKIQEMMKRNQESKFSNRESPQKHQESQQMEYDFPSHTNNEGFGNFEKFGTLEKNKMQFEIKYQVQNLQKKIKEQERQKEDKIQEAKRGAIDLLMKMKKKSNEEGESHNTGPNSLSIQPPEYSKGLELKENNYKVLMSPTQNDSLHDFDSEPDETHETDQHKGRNVDTAYFQRSAKFDSILREEEIKEENEDNEENDDIYEEEYEEEPQEEIHPLHQDELDKNMEIPIPKGPINHRYQQTFGEPSEQSYGNFSNINPLDESDNSYGITPIRPKTTSKITKNDDWDDFDLNNAEEGKTNSKDHNSTNVFQYEQPTENQSSEKDFQLSFRFKNKEMENLNRENVVFTSKGMRKPDGLQNLDDNDPLKEFADLHNEAKTVLSKGNFSFGTKFFDSDKEISKDLRNSDDDFDFDSDNSPKPAPAEVAKQRKQWGKKEAPGINFSPDFNEVRGEDTLAQMSPKPGFFNKPKNLYSENEADSYEPTQNFQEEDDNYNDDFEPEDDVDEDQEAAGVCDKPSPVKNVAMEINFASTQEMKKIQAKKQQFLKRREENEKKRKLEWQKKREEQKNASNQYSNVIPQSAQIRKTQKQVDEGYSKHIPDAAGSAKTKNRGEKLNSPVSDLKKNIRRNNLMGDHPVYKKPKNPGVKISQPSNKKLIKNAISSVCLAGEVCKHEREEVLQVLQDNDSKYFIILLQTSLGRQKFKGLYSHDGLGTVNKLYGGTKMPTEILEDYVNKYYKYDSGAKEFKEVVGMKRFNVSTDAVSLHPAMLKRLQSAHTVEIKDTSPTMTEYTVPSYNIP